MAQLTLRQSGERLPESRCFVEDKRPLCQLSSKRLEDNWHSGLLSSTKIGFLEGAHPIAAELMNGDEGVGWWLERAVRQPLR